MKNVIINDIEYEILRNEKEAFSLDDVLEKITEYFFEFDYIFGDYSYDKLRLKGYYDENSKNRCEYNDIRDLDNYIDEYCSYGAKYFLLKKYKLKK